MRIPKCFSLMGHEIAVERSPSLIDKDEEYGCTIYDENRIVVQAPRRGIKASVLEQTFCHELVHLILYFMNEHALNGDEKFVDQFGQLLHQALSTRHNHPRST